MLQMTALRVQDRSLFAPPIIVAPDKQHFQVVQQLAEIAVTPSTLILEPVGRNTAPAISMAAQVVDPSSILLVMPSDHLILNSLEFEAAIANGVHMARQGSLVTFGTRPVRAETGFGYIRRGREISDSVFAVDRFVEKPDLETATAFLQAGTYDWNCGIFMFRSDTILEALEKHAPDIAMASRRSVTAGAREGNVLRPEPSEFLACRAQSIDHAVLEHYAPIAVVTVDMDWSDLGSWDALYEVATKDLEGNAVQGNAIALDSATCLLRSDELLLIGVGLENILAVSSGNAIIIIPRGQSERLKEVIALLRERDPAALD